MSHKNIIDAFECSIQHFILEEFEKLYQCWPDQYYILSVDHTILKKSEYTMDAVIEEDYADYLISELTVI
jgi:hypothetical protein